MKPLCLSIAKPGQNTVNEDAARASERMAAVSDGAGGGGIYAERWSAYLIEKLPEQPITRFEEFDKWVDDIWEDFYNECEAAAKQAGGLVLNKFYDEGSFATLAAIWVDGEKAHWMAYGDSVAFCYDTESDTLRHSFTRLSDFNKPPFLVNYNHPLNASGFRAGTFDVGTGSLLFCASDALAHYLLMMYEQSHREQFADELLEAEQSGTKFSLCIKAASEIGTPFSDTIKKLTDCAGDNEFERCMETVLKERLAVLDDYSFACIGCWE